VAGLGQTLKEKARRNNPGDSEKRKRVRETERDLGETKKKIMGKTGPGGAKIRRSAHHATKILKMEDVQKKGRRNLGKNDVYEKKTREEASDERAYKRLAKQTPSSSGKQYEIPLENGVNGPRRIM